jgi:hypothetical protein
MGRFHRPFGNFIGHNLENQNGRRSILHLCALKMPKVTGPFSLITAHFPLENGRFE